MIQEKPRRSQDYSKEWTSQWHEIYDTRLKLEYQWVSQEVDIYGKRPKYETYTTEVKDVEI